MSNRIIIIEDEAMIALDLERIVTSLGYTVVGRAMNGDKALDLFANNPCDLVLLDVHIKGTLNGIDLAKFINQKYQIPFIYITSFADKYTLQKTSETMPYGFIVKPFSQKDLASNIAMAMARASAEKPINEIEKYQHFEEKLGMQLSDRDIDILRLLIDGCSYKEVGERLNISINTVKTYQKRIFNKFKVESKIQLVNLIRGL